MKFLEQMYKWERGINFWMTDHPGKSTLYAGIILAISFALMRINVDLGFIPVLVSGVVCVFMMLCSAVYMVKSNWQPERCDKCGHVLPEKRP